MVISRLTLKQCASKNFVFDWEMCYLFCEVCYFQKLAVQSNTPKDNFEILGKKTEKRPIYLRLLKTASNESSSNGRSSSSASTEMVGTSCVVHLSYKVINMIFRYL